MSEHGTDRDAELVRRIAEHYRPADPSPAARVAFRARLDARIRRRAQLRLWIAGVATSAVATAVAVIALGPLTQTATETPGAPVAAVDAEEALLALALPSSDAETLPADYQAIDELLLEGEGV